MEDDDAAAEEVHADGTVLEDAPEQRRRHRRRRRSRRSDGAAGEGDEAADETPGVEEDGVAEDPPEAAAPAGEAAADAKDAQKELEEDAPEDSSQKVADGAVELSMGDATLNAVTTSNGKLLTCLGEGGLQYLLASARTTVGMKAGRYMFEAKIVMNHSFAEQPPTTNTARAPAPKQLLRVGVSLAGLSAGSPVILGDTEDSVGFDSDGGFFRGKKRHKAGHKFGFDTIAVLVNLDAKSPNFNTVSLFINGERASEPQSLPENMRGKVLYPTFTYRNVTLRTHFGVKPMVALPFKCRTLQDAAASDVHVSTVAAPVDGKYEVVYPIGLPTQGCFDWADEFLEKNPHFTELSDRKLLDWASRSGLIRPKSQKRGSTDQPAFNFGLPLMDDYSVKTVLTAVAPLLRRNFLVMELRANLLAEERGAHLARFPSTEFKRVASVMIGEPTVEYKARVQQLMLADKQALAESEKRKKAIELERKKLLEEKRRKAEEAKKLREVAAAKRKKKKGATDEDGEGGEEPPEEVEKEDEARAEDEANEEEAPAPDPVLELTDEEKMLWYRKTEVPDLGDDALGRCFAKFTLPTKAENFDEIRFEWQPEEKSVALLREFVLSQKKTQKVQDLPITDWFKDMSSKWQKTISGWKSKQKEWKDPIKRKAMRKERAEEKGEDELMDDTDNNAEEEVDVFTVEDVMDIGNGEPLFAHFVFEDWTLLTARWEFHALLHGFRKALDDPDRLSFPEKDLQFYYQRHFNKSFNLKAYAAETFDEFIDLVRDTVNVNSEGYLVAQLEEDKPFPYFVMLTEEHRRERERRVDAGDETARLKFPPPQQQSRREGSSRGGARVPHSDRGSSGQARRGLSPTRGSGGAPPPSKRSRQTPYSAYGTAPLNYPSGSSGRAMFGGGGVYGAPGGYGNPPSGYGSGYGSSNYGSTYGRHQ
eukprot:TRINITY_DN5465_c0_g1_i1.p1 TRINITY_DN5465_c0_g1~~TRINITY_DN5465_c0_g1_i1.p1  ORF type:complete len:1000 (+),score=263.77 TRINITY_DN5465_c0_g1_i1:210-3002(+)